ncbi:hypothetical protein ESOMN_v1c04750 [Williamsoniiplasma somnilux]|uniref:MFS transporter n=1 Tax=Williamsoniiplasma somnilux TaxID=215578 RepID=A0A2K8NYI9_9MOLU|nr:MFS cation transporter [Williamsoniiplasma somnilux]ATZ18857.1 hypothetical protein ESOMN_v1c04750 [Williamsoniiplasma somnilux]
MKFNWDLFLLDPLFIIFGIFLIWIMAKKEKNERTWILFYISTLLIWIANGFVIKTSTMQLGFIETNSSTWLTILGIFGASTFFAMIFKPLATKITSKIKSRRIWIWAAMASTIISLILIMIFNDSSQQIFITIVCGILVGFSLSSQLLFLLIFNEQAYYRFFPLKTAVKIGALTSLGTFIGGWMLSLNLAFQNSNFWTEKININITGSICIFLSLVSLILNLFVKENKYFIGEFELEVKNQFITYSKKTLIILLITVFSLGLIFSLTQASFIDLYLAAVLKEMHFSKDQIYQIIRIYKEWYIVPQFLVGYLIYNFVYKKIGPKHIMIISIILTSLLSLILAFVHNPFVFVIANFFLGLCFTQCLYILYGMSMMWLYRVKSIPITGIVGTAILAGPFIFETIILVLKNLNIGFFTKFKTIQDVLNNLEHQTLLNDANSVISILFSIIFAFSMGYLFWVIFFGDAFLGEYKKYGEIVIKVKNVERNFILNKIKRKMEL